MFRCDCSQDEVVLRVRDYGKGIPRGGSRALSPAIARTAASDWPGMRERIHELGGQLEMDSDGHGTQVRGDYAALGTKKVLRSFGRLTDVRRHSCPPPRSDVAWTPGAKQCHAARVKRKARSQTSASERVRRRESRSPRACAQSVTVSCSDRWTVPPAAGT